MEIPTEKLKTENETEIMAMVMRLKAKAEGKPCYTKFVMQPMFYLEIPTWLGEDRYHRRGYIVHIDTADFNAVGARYFHEEGEGTYRELPLSKDQFKVLTKFTCLSEHDTFFDFYQLMMK